MDFRPIVAPSIRELFIQQLEGAILSGQLKPGDRLPTERELADTMHISKTVVHEGLRELHRLGFLDIASRRGVTVADYAQTGSLETLTAIMDYHGGLPDEKTRPQHPAPAVLSGGSGPAGSGCRSYPRGPGGAAGAAAPGPDGSEGGTAGGPVPVSPGCGVPGRQHHHASAVQRL